ncbi:MAG: hypothetical protein WC247_16285 [Porticoccaceae bacterium]
MSTPAPHHPAGRQRGVALAMLLWMLAALSLLVSGVVYQARTDVQLTALQRDQARTQAAATGAAHLLLRDLLLARNDGSYGGSATFTARYTLGGLAITARAIPVSGLVDLNQAPAELLADLFHYTGRLSRDAAAQLAEALVERRQPAGLELGLDDHDAGNAIPLRVIEDLLRVPGMTRVVYDRVRTAIHTEPGGQPGVDPLAAPPGVLRTIAQGDDRLVDFIVDARQDGPADASQLPSGLNLEHLAAGMSTAYCLEIDVRLDDGRMAQQRIWADMAGGANGLPWRFTRVQPVEFTAHQRTKE